jgi:asparagine synthase (glutamine-hydrolysing)
LIARLLVAATIAYSSMGGIAGLIDLHASLPSGEAIVAQMTDALLHRGPDDAGLLVDPPAVIGHRQLDVAQRRPRGRQPMASGDGRRWIVLDGQIFNLVELADRLRELGWTFETSCDAEVLLAGLEEWGDQVLPGLNGDFALAVWDREEQELLCARDQFGVKPFYYTVAGGRFRFASEIKALLLDPEVPRRPNDRRVLDFLAYGQMDHTDETLFEGVRQLPPGSLLRVTPAQGPGDPTTYYRPKPADLNGKAPAEAVRERLTEAVRLRLTGDAPLGMALSGGLDSCSVMSVASRLLAEEGASPPACFTARCDDPAIDEWELAQHTVRAAGAQCFEVKLDDRKLLHELDSYLWAMDEPFMNPTVYGYWKVLDVARQSGARVIFDGRAGDECFFGHGYLHSCLLYNLLCSGHWLRALSEIRWRQRRWGIPARRSLVDLAKFMVPNRFRQRKLPPWLSPDAPVPPPQLPKRSLGERQRNMLLVNMLDFEHHYDRNTMSMGLESRSPFLDPNVVECALTLEARDVLHEGFMKWALREAMRGIVPPETVDNAPKQGFGVDLSLWFEEGELGDALEEMFRSPEMLSRPYFDSAQLLAALEAHRAGTSDRPLIELWRAFVVERWLRLFIDSPQLEPPAPHPSAPTSSISAADCVLRPADRDGSFERGVTRVAVASATTSGV